MSSDTATVPAAWSDRLADLVPDRRTLAWAAILVNAEAIAVLAYISLPTVTPTAIRYYVYPFVWINVGLWALVRTWPAADRNAGRDGRNGANAQSRKRGWLGGGRKRYLASALAAGYFLVLAYVGPLLGLGHTFSSMTGMPLPSTFRIAWLPPGWGPALLYNGAFVSITLLPFVLVGYLALAYLVYATVLDAVGSAIGGVLGVLSCVSCTWPVLASLVGGVAGGTSLAAVVANQSYALSTVVFVLTVVLLHWRPFGRR